MNSKGWDLESKKALGFLSEFNFALTEEWIQEEERRETAFKALNPFPETVTTQLKNLARMGVPMSYRRHTWLVASKGIELLKKYGNIYESAVKAVETRASKHEFTEEELFGGSVKIVHFLPESLIPTIRQFLKVVWSNNNGIQYSPLIPTISIILLLFMEPPLAYLSIQAMINKSREDSWYFTVDKKAFHSSVIATEKLVYKKVADVAEHAANLELNIAYIALSLMPAFFLPFMPIPVALTIFDSFIVEGRKILSRFIIQLFKQSRKELLKTTTQQEFINVIVSEMDKLSNVKELTSFLQSCFKMYLARKPHIVDLEKEAEHDQESILSLNRGADVISTILSNIPSDIPNPLSFPRVGSEGSLFIRSVLEGTTPEEMKRMQDAMQEQFFQKALPTVCTGRVKKRELKPFQMTISESDESTTADIDFVPIFTNSMFYSMRNFIPHAYQRHNPDLIYKMSRDGTAFRSFIASAIAPVPHFLIIKTKLGHVIGALLSDPPNPSLRKHSLERYFGNPTMFVFKADQTAVCYKLSVPPNNSFISIDRGMIMIGGPEPAILILESFSTVISKPCETFGSPSLLENPEGEEILDVEMYQFSLSYSSIIGKNKK